jgi:peptidoglycan/LPS O-acetylase OafA/YrhL
LDSSRPRHRFRRDIEGLRCVAIATVVLFHAGVPGFAGGFIGVDVFLVLSGFLITDLLWKELHREDRIGFAAFYARRARRILPVSTLVIVATALVAWRVVPPLELASVTRDGLASALFVANIRFALAHTSYLTVAAPSAFQQYWSLGVEEQFYLVWPAVLLWVSRTRRLGQRSRGQALAVLAGLSLVSLLASWWLTGVNQPWAFFSLPTRAWELGAGALLALGQPWLKQIGVGAARVLGWLGLAAVAWAATQLSAATPYPGLAALIPVAGTAAVIAAGCAPHRGGAEWLLGHKPFRAGGRVSYALYLWHWPILVLVPLAVGHALSLAANLGLVLVAIGLSAVTVVIVEAPIRFAPQLAPTRRALSLGAVLIAVAVVATIALPVPAVTGRGVAVALPAGRAPVAAAHATHDPVDPLTAALASATAPVTAAVAASVGVQAVPANLDPTLARAHANAARPFIDGCLASFTATTPGTCTYGSAQPVANVVVFGDSHAAMWFPAFDTVANQRNWRLEVLTKATCPPLETAVWAPNFGREYRECDAFHTAALARIASLRPNLVVLDMNRAYGTAYHLDQYGPVWLAGLTATIAAIRADGSQVLVIGPVPHPANDEPNCLSTNLDHAVNCSQAVSDAYDVAGLAREQAAVVAAGGHYLDVRPWFCTATRCAVIVGNMLLYRDENHITTTYATWLAPVMAAQLDTLRVLPPPPPPTTTSTLATTTTRS